MNNIIKKIWKNPKILKAIEEAEKQSRDTYSFICLNMASGKIHIKKINNISPMKNKGTWGIVLEYIKNSDKNGKK